MLIIGSNHNQALEYMAQEASFHGIHTLIFSPLIAETTQLQDLIHAKLTGLFSKDKLYTGIKLNCVPDRDDDLENRTTAKLNHYRYRAVLKQISFFE